MLGLWLLAGHMAGDYLFQTEKMAARKLSDWRWRIRHVLVYTTFFTPIAAVAVSRLHVAVGEAEARYFGFLVSLAVLHFLTDSKRWRTANPWPPMPILVDQSLHIIQLAALGTLFLA